MKKLLLIISIAIVGCGESGNSEVSGIYTWSHRGNDDASERNQKIDLRDDGTYEWPDDFFENGVRSKEWSDNWRGEWEIKDSMVVITHNDDTHHFRIEGNGDIVNTHKNGGELAAKDQLRYSKK